MNAWQNIETAEVEFLNNLAEHGGLPNDVAGMLRHCARLVGTRADGVRLRNALTEYPSRNPHQLQAKKVCAGVIALARAPQPTDEKVSP